jgi:hypothetical protein
MPFFNKSHYLRQLHYPAEDVVKNVRHFINVVRRATGNQSQSTDKDQNSRPGMLFLFYSLGQ